MIMESTITTMIVIFMAITITTSMMMVIIIMLMIILINMNITTATVMTTKRKSLKIMIIASMVRRNNRLMTTMAMNIITIIIIMLTMEVTSMDIMRMAMLMHIRMHTRKEKGTLVVMHMNTMGNMGMVGAKSMRMSVQWEREVARRSRTLENLVCILNCLELR